MRSLLRFGVMCEGTTFRAWQAQCLGHLLEVPGVELVLLIVDAEGQGANSLGGQLRRFTEPCLFWRLYGRLRRRLPWHATLVDMADRLSSVPVLRCRVRREGKFSQYFSEEDCEAIREYDLDFVLRFGFNIIRGEILEVPRYGVWSYHHDDLDKYRGAPPCFWEVYHGDPVTGVVLQRLTERLDGGVVLKRGWFPSCLTSYSRNCEQAFRGSTEWPAEVCRDILAGRADYLEAAPAKTAARIFYPPSTLQTLTLAWRTALRSVKSSWDSALNDMWDVGLVPHPIHEFLKRQTPADVRWLGASDNHRYYADPFGLPSREGMGLLVEEFDHLDGTGRICAVSTHDGASLSRPTTAISLPVHMSYPYLFEYEGSVYCVPETRFARQVFLYRAEEFPTKWARVGVLLDDFPAVDPTVFVHENRWWLLCTNGDTGPNTKLYAWYASSPCGPWTPHAGNPIKTDVRSSRPAGTPFVHEGVLYRPSQDCSLGYGCAVVINRVDCLSPSAFSEEVVNVVRPDPNGPYPDGLHTLSAVGGQTLIDGKRWVFSARFFAKRIASRLRMRGSAIAGSRSTPPGTA